MTMHPSDDLNSNRGPIKDVTDGEQRGDDLDDSTASNRGEQPGSDNTNLHSYSAASDGDKDKTSGASDTSTAAS